MSERYDVVIVGGGIVGLATAYRLLASRPGLRLAVIEKEHDLALHQSGRNSGVIHAGLYYAPGSLKARLCREGKDALERFCEEHDIPFERCGKLVVAVDGGELSRLADLKARGEANGLRGLEEIGPERIREIEPYAAGVRALHLAETGIVDFRRVALAYADEIRSRGGRVLLGHRVTDIERMEHEIVVETSRGPILTHNVISCAGLQSDRVARMSGAPELMRIVPFRGDYLALLPHARELVRGLLYPVPDPAFPFLGVHFTRRIDGEVWAGPNAVLALARERYSRLALDPRDAAATLVYPGFLRLARRYWRAGLAEMRRDVSKAAFVAACRRLVPELGESDVAWGPSGIRAQTVLEGGELADDFSVQASERILHVRNAPSPAATASLAIGRVLAAHAAERFELPA
ncbi:MAG TPA: L-2-hydroxyglutarate oxidase [Actinomycetota bacterium]|nr:L-2-hydroxyglutarate oxidase [Actinomycetota bacterium]